MRRHILVTLLILASLHYASHISSSQENPALSMDIIIVLDNSGSMKTNDPEFLTRNTVSDFLERLSGDVRIGFVIFGEKAWLEIPLISISDEETNQKIAQTLDKVDYSGQYTNIPAAIERAIYELKENGRDSTEKLIIFITDGIIDTGDQARDIEKYGWLRDELAVESMEAKIRIFGIAFTDQADFELIQALGRKTDGGYYRAFKADDIQAVLSRINETISKPKPEPEPEPAVEVATTPEIKEGFPVKLLMLAVVGLFAICMVSVMVFGRKAGAVQGRASQGSIPEACLVDLDGAIDGEAYKISKRIITIGREENDGIDIPLGIGTVSAAHAQVEYRDHGFYLTDLHSTNGTYLNERKEEHRVTDTVRLKNGDIVFFDQYRLGFITPDQDEWDRTQLSQLRGETIMRDLPDQSSPESGEGDPPLGEKETKQEVHALPASQDEISKTPGMCPEHPGIEATELCPICQEAVCIHCTVGEDGDRICKECASKMEEAKPGTKPYEIKGEETREDEFMSLDELEKGYIQKVLKSTKGNKTKAAETMGISRQALYKKMKKLGIST